MPLKNCFPCLHFQNEDVITKLDFSNTVLTDAFPDVWQYERTLEELNLSSTRINNLPPQLFYCQGLRVLMVNNNSLESIPIAIGTLRQLQHLNLSRNLILNVPDNIKTCRNLTHLDLSCNSLQRLPDAITSLISLRELLLNETYLEFLPANFGRLVNLRILELRLNNLITLPKSMARLTNLQRIDIGGNEFTELPEVVGELHQLRELWIDFNQIRHVTSNIGKLRELQHFEANGNLIDIMPNEMSHWRNIEVLSVCTNNLDALPFSIGMMSSLVTFKCESNELHELPDSISNLENLEELALSHNKLLRLPNTIGMLRKLRFLFADDNELQALPEEICSCNSLTVLSVSHNKITELPQNIGRLTQLKVLNLVNNLVSSLPVSILSLVNLTSLWISDNQSQPLVPLQYLDADTKTQLTCFMLPQVSPRTQQLHAKYHQLDDHIYQDKYDEYAQRKFSDQQLYAMATKACTTSPTKRICFAEEATLLAPAAVQNAQLQSISGNAAVAAAAGNTTSTASVNHGVRLMRSPTPYPKELRLMAKYVRNSQKPAQYKPTADMPPHATEVRADRPSNTSNCDINKLENNNVKSLVNGNADGTFFAIASQPYDDNQQQQQYQFQYTIPQTSNYQLLHRQQGQPSPSQQQQQQFYTVYYTPSVDMETMYDNLAYDSAASINPLELDYVASNQRTFQQQPLMEPPPYHIARVFTKKSPEDLTNYETIRNQQQQQQHQKHYPNGMLDHTAELDNIADRDEGSFADNEASIYDRYRNSISPEDEVNFITNKPVTDVVDHQNNFLANSVAPTNSVMDATLVSSDIAYSDHFVQQQQNDLNGSLSQLSLRSSSNSLSTCLSQGNNASGATSSKKAPWLFGVHKNPTVKQVAIKWEDHIGFDVTELPNQEGIFVMSLVPNTNASGLLCVNDKLLEIDGYDCLNMNAVEAKNILSKAGSVINIMLSRK